MKMTLLNGALPQVNFGLSKVTFVVAQTLSELGVDVAEINVPFMQIPAFDGVRSERCAEVAASLQESEGVILAAAVTPYSMGASLAAFFEHLALPEFGGVLAGKNCLVLLVYEGGGQTEAFAYYAGVLRHFGAYDAVRLALPASHAAGEAVSPEARDMIEKYVEDYYRIARQNRRFVTGAAPAGSAPLPSAAASASKPPKKSIYDIVEGFNIDEIDEKQEKDISEITRLFAEKMNTPDDEADVLAPALKPKGVLLEELSEGSKKVEPRTKTCQQMTASLPHYFQPQLAGGMREVIQLLISGSETVTGYLTIKDGECTYADGQADAPDMTILADASAWMNVLKGNVTAQKAFMVGQLKVRGNFVLLTKFELLFSRL